MVKKKLTPHQEYELRIKNLRGSALRKLNHHEFTHRLMRVLGLVHAMPVKEGFPREELIIRSAMASNILVADAHDKISIEAGTLSFIPQYCEYETAKQKKIIHKEISDNLGRKRLELFKEVEELRQAFVQELNIAGFSVYAKEIYLVHIYLDLVNMFNSWSNMKVLDGELIKVRIAKKPVRIDKDTKLPPGEQYVIIDGDKMDMPRFYAYMVAMAQWKLEEMNWNRHNIITAIQELCRQIRNTQGVEVYYNEYSS